MKKKSNCDADARAGTYCHLQDGLGTPHRLSRAQSRDELSTSPSVDSGESMFGGHQQQQQQQPTSTRQALQGGATEGEEWSGGGTSLLVPNQTVTRSSTPSEALPPSMKRTSSMSSLTGSNHINVTVLDSSSVDGEFITREGFLSQEGFCLFLFFFVCSASFGVGVNACGRERERERRGLSCVCISVFQPARFALLVLIVCLCVVMRGRKERVCFHFVCVFFPFQSCFFALLVDRSACARA